MKIQDSQTQVANAHPGPREFPDLGALLVAHVQREFANRDVNATMNTMVPEPYVHCIPTLSRRAGGRLELDEVAGLCDGYGEPGFAAAK